MCTTDDHGSAGDVPPPVDQLARLLQRCAAGDAVAFAEVYDATAPWAFGLALRVVRDPRQAEDATHQAYSEIWRRASSFDPAGANARAWVLAVVHRVAVDHLRSTQSGAAGADRSGSEGAGSTLRAPLANRAPTHLSMDQQQALDLAYWDGHTCRQVAALLGVREDTVRTRLTSGLQRVSR